MLWNRILILLADQLDWPKLLRGVAEPRAIGSQSHGLLVSHRVSEYEMAEPAEDHTVSLQRATSTRRTPGRNWGPRHRLETPIQSPSKAQQCPIQNSVGWAWMSRRSPSVNNQRVTRQHRRENVPRTENVPGELASSIAG